MVEFNKSQKGCIRDSFDRTLYNTLFEVSFLLRRFNNLSTVLNPKVEFDKKKWGRMFMHNKIVTSSTYLVIEHKIKKEDILEILVTSSKGMPLILLIVTKNRIGENIEYNKLT